MAKEKNKGLMADNELFEADAQKPVEQNIPSYGDENIKTVSGLAHVRMRPGMYIGKLGDGSHSDDGIYILLKEVLDNSIDEFRMKCGNTIEVNCAEGAISVRDYGRGIPLGKIIDCVSEINTSGKFDDKAFKRSVGLNGVGAKAANALSERFVVQSFREGKMRRAEFVKGELLSDTGIVENETGEQNGTYIYFKPDNALFVGYQFKDDFISTMLKNYSFLNSGLAIVYNGKRFYNKSGLAGLLADKMTEEPLYPIVHLKGENIEIALTHCNQNGEEYYSFVNGQYTVQGGTHLMAFKEYVGKTVKEFYDKNLDVKDIRMGICGAIALDVQEPMFESQTKVKLGSRDMDPTSGITVNKYVGDFIKTELDNFLHKNQETADAMLAKIQESEANRKQIEGLTKGAKESKKKISLHNEKLRDCRVHLNDTKKEKSKDNTIDDIRQETSIFITEGNSASGSITKSRDANIQAVFSLRGKPKNLYGKNPVEIYKNAELVLLQAALNIEESLDGLRYNKVIIATDADDDGMHIRLLLLTFFLQYYPDLIKKGHVYILQTPLFRVRDKQKTFYCYNEEEKLEAIGKLGGKPEITRFKGLGEISPKEFEGFIGKDIRLDQVQMRKEDAVADILAFYMGKNTIDRRNFIIDNLVIEEDYTD